jgi:phosphomannomutase
MKRMIVFDLDGTLAKSKSSLDDEMAKLLGQLLDVIKVAVISGGAWPQFQKQLLIHLPHDDRLKDLSLLPTSGTRCLKYDGEWKQPSTGAKSSRIGAARSPCPPWARTHP